MNFHPGGEIIRVAGFVGELGEVEPCGGRGGVVACGAVLLNEGVGAGKGRSCGHSGSSEESGGEGNTQSRCHDGIAVEWARKPKAVDRVQKTPARMASPLLSSGAFAGATPITTGHKKRWPVADGRLPPAKSHEKNLWGRLQPATASAGPLFAIVAAWFFYLVPLCFADTPMNGNSPLSDGT